MSRKSRWFETLATIRGKGYRAFKEGKSLEDNPYLGGRPSKNGDGGSVQEQRKKAWNSGWYRAEAEQVENDPIDQFPIKG